MTRRLVGVAALALLVISCGGRADPPPSPDRTLVADIIGIGDRWEFGPCNTYVVTLLSRQVITVVPAGFSQEGCNAEPTALLFGKSSDFTAGADAGVPWRGREGPLIFAGSDGQRPWLASVTRDFVDRWCFWFDKGQGAYLTPDGLHLTSGLVLPLAADFQRPTYPDDAFPLRNADQLCLNAAGEAVSVQIWSPI